ARMPWLANLRNNVPGAAMLTEKLLGFSAKRTLPTWRRDSFLNNAESVGPEHADVVLFADTFNNYFESENAHAALRVLQAAGYRVHVARASAHDSQPNRPLCCGRTYLASGMIDH